MRNEMKSREMMVLTKKQLSILEAVGSLQLFIQTNCSEEPNLVISFESRGTDFVHPLLDETGRKSVNPITYYEKTFLNSKFMDLI